LLFQKDLTPEGLARVFADFTFELGPQVQEPETFLRRKRGDCADFSNLASAVLTRLWRSAKFRGRGDLTLLCSDGGEHSCSRE
jgi:GH24 family phage-related lysozyme (muramidase)